jgi:hypothetical protein
MDRQWKHLGDFKESTSSGEDDAIISELLFMERLQSRKDEVDAAFKTHCEESMRSFWVPMGYREFVERFFALVITPEAIQAWKLANYSDLRRVCYPPTGEMADALVKNDEAQLEAYRQKCLAVKERFPKP